MCLLVAQEWDSYILAAQATQHRFYVPNGVFLYLEEVDYEPPNGIFPSDDELDALFAISFISLVDTTNIEEKPPNPLEEGVIYTNNDIVPYEHVYPPYNDNQGNYPDIHYVS